MISRSIPAWTTPKGLIAVSHPARKFQKSSFESVRVRTWNGKYISNLTALLPVLLIAGFACQQRPVTPISQTLKWDGPQFRVLKEEARQLHKKGRLMQAAPPI